jgi:hypothetical protein
MGRPDHSPSAQKKLTFAAAKRRTKTALLETN